MTRDQVWLPNRLLRRQLLNDFQERSRRADDNEQQPQLPAPLLVSTPLDAKPLAGAIRMTTDPIMAVTGAPLPAFAVTDFDPALIGDVDDFTSTVSTGTGVAR